MYSSTFDSMDLVQPLLRPLELCRLHCSYTITNKVITPLLVGGGGLSHLCPLIL
jgi:hypothetical protein